MKLRVLVASGLAGLLFIACVPESAPSAEPEPDATSVGVDGGGPPPGTTSSDGGQADSASDGGEEHATSAPDGLSLVAGGASGYLQVDGVGADARLMNVDNFAFDPVGRVAWLEPRLRRFDLAKNEVTSPNIGLPPYLMLGIDGPKGTATVDIAETAVAYDAAGKRLFTATGSRIRTFDLTTGTMATLVGVENDPVQQDGDVTKARFAGLQAIAFDSKTKRLYARSMARCAVRVIDTTTGDVTTKWSGGAGCSDPNGLNSTDIFVHGLAFDGDHTLFVSDGGNLRSIDTNGSVVATPTLSGSVTSGFEYLAYDPMAKKLYASAAKGAANKLVVSIDPLSGAVTTIAGTEGIRAMFVDASTGTVFGARSTALVAINGGVTSIVAGVDHIPPGDTDGAGAAARFGRPVAVAYDTARGRAYVVDGLCIRSVDLESGATTVLAGFPGAQGVVDGAKGSSSFGGPQGVAYDPDTETLYVADVESRLVSGLIRAVDVRTGTLTTLMGDAQQYGGIVDGPKIKARLTSPRALEFDRASKTLYFADCGSAASVSGGCVRALDTTKMEIRTIAGQNAYQQKPLDGLANAAMFSGLSGLALDAANGVLYALDISYAFISNRGFQTSVIRSIRLSDGNVVTVAGAWDGTNPGVQVDGASDVARFVGRGGYGGVVFDAKRRKLYIADASTIRSWDSKTGTVATFVGAQDRIGVLTGPFTKASLYGVGGLAMVGDGDMLLTDVDGNVLLRAKGF